VLGERGGESGKGVSKRAGLLQPSSIDETRTQAGHPAIVVDCARDSSPHDPASRKYFLDCFIRHCSRGHRWWQRL